jgi:hypothetical protein
VTDAVLRRFRDSKHRVLFCDAEGLLVPAQPVTAAVAPKSGGGAAAGKASAEESDAADSTTSTASVSAARVVSPAALQALRDLARGTTGATASAGAAASIAALAASGAAAATTVVITSRMPRERLEALFGDEPFILVAENGAFVRWAPECVWECELPDPSPAWFSEVLPVFRYFADRTPGSVLDIKETSISWHYAGCDPQYGPFQARDLASTLAEFVSCLPVIVVTSAFNQYVEMRRPHANKALVVYNLLRRLNAYRDLHADPHAQQLPQQGPQGSQLTTSGVAAPSSFTPLLQHMTLPAVHLRKDLRRYLASRSAAAGAKGSGLALAAVPAAVPSGGPAPTKADPTGATAYTGAAGDTRTTANDAPTTMTVSVAYAQQATAAVVPHLSPDAVMPRPASFRERACGAAAAGAPQPGSAAASETKTGGARGTTADPAYAAVSAMYQRLFPQAPVDFVLCMLAPSDPKDADVFTLLQRMQADVLESAPSATPGGAAGMQGLASLAGSEVAGADASSGSTDAAGRRVSVTTIGTATDSTAGTDLKGPRIASPHATQVSQPHALLKEVAGHGAPSAVTVGAAAAQAAHSVTGAGTASERGTPPPGAAGGRPLSAASRQERVLGYGLRNLLASAVTPTAHHRQGSGQLARSLSHGQGGEAEAIINPTPVIALTPAGAPSHMQSPLLGGAATGGAAPAQPGAQMPPQTAEQEAILNAVGAPVAAAAAAPPRSVGAAALLAGVGAPPPGATTATAPAAGPAGALGQAVDAVADRKAGAAGSGSCNLSGGSGEDAALAGASEEAAAEAAEADALAQEEVAGLSLPPPRPLRAYAATRKATVASMGSLANLAGLADSVGGPASGAPGAARGGRADASGGAATSQQGAHTLLGGRGRVLTSVDLDTFELTGPSAGGGGGVGGGSGDSGLAASGPSSGASGASRPSAAEPARSHSQRAAAESKSSRSLHQLQTIAAGISAASDANKAVAAARRAGSGEGFRATPVPTRAAGAGAGGGAHVYMPSPRIGERPYDLRGRPITFQRTDSDSSGVTATSHSPAPRVEAAVRPERQRQTAATGPERSSSGRGRASSGASDAFGLLHATIEEETPARAGATSQTAAGVPRTAAGAKSASSALQPMQPVKAAMAGPGATAAPLAPAVGKAAAASEHAAADATSSLAGLGGGCGVCFIDCAVGRKEARRGARWYLSSADAAASLLQLMVHAEQQARA